MAMTSNWFLWVLLSAVFAALTAIFAKIGLEEVDSDLATLIRTVVIMIVLATFVYFAGKWSNPFELSLRTWLFWVLSGLVTQSKNSMMYFFTVRQLPPDNIRSLQLAQEVDRDPAE